MPVSIFPAPLKAAVYDRGLPPDSFLAALIQWAPTASDEIFAPNSRLDIYSSVRSVLGPWQGFPHRKAAMLEVLRCLAGFESSWNWNAGVDTTNRASMTYIDGQETGIFQVSFNSAGFDPSLRDCVKRFCGKVSAQAFIDRMKVDHDFALEYCARLLRFSIAWDGPIKRRELHPWLRRDAVDEFQRRLSA